MSYSPNSKIIVTGLEDGTILIWDAATQQQMGKLKGHSGWIYGLSFSPDGKTLASGSRDNTVKIWDVQHLQNFWPFRVFPRMKSPSSVLKTVSTKKFDIKRFSYFFKSAEIERVVAIYAIILSVLLFLTSFT